MGGDSESKSGSRIRRHAYAPVYARWKYVCDALFSGDLHRVARATHLDARDLQRIYRKDSQLTIRLAAHFVAKLGLNAEWLLCGTGPMLKVEDSPENFVLPVQLSSPFPIFDGIEHAAGTDFLSTTFFSATQTPTIDGALFVEAAQAVYAARVNRKPVGVFVGQPVFTCFPHNTVVPLFTEQYATFLVATLGVAIADLAWLGDVHGFDINTVARAAALHGAGYGETFVKTLQPVVKTLQRGDTAVKSFLAAVSAVDVPVLFSVEFGEISRHTVPAVRGAEVGAAIGAAAYVDLLMFTAQLQNFFGQPGGVFIVIGDEVRGVRLLLERFEALRFAAPEQTGFTVVIFAEYDRSLSESVRRCGGTVLFLCEPTAASLALFRAACADVSAGKVPYDQIDD